MDKLLGTDKQCNVETLKKELKEFQTFFNNVIFVIYEMQKDLELIRRLNNYQKWIPYLYDSSRIHENNITLGNEEKILSKITLYGKLESKLICYPFGQNLFDRTIHSARCSLDDGDYYECEVNRDDNLITVTIDNSWKEGDTLTLEITI